MVEVNKTSEPGPHFPNEPASQKTELSPHKRLPPDAHTGEMDIIQDNITHLIELQEGTFPEANPEINREEQAKSERALANLEKRRSSARGNPSEEEELEVQIKGERENQRMLLQTLPQAEISAQQLALMQRVYQQNYLRLQRAHEPPKPTDSLMQSIFQRFSFGSVGRAMKARTEILKQAPDILKDPKKVIPFLQTLHEADSNVSRAKEGKPLNVHFPYLGTPPDASTTFCEISLGYKAYEQRAQLREQLLARRIEASRNDNPVQAEAIARVLGRLDDLERYVALSAQQEKVFAARAHWEMDLMKREGTFPQDQAAQEALHKQLMGGSGSLNVREVNLPLLLTEAEFQALSDLLPK